MPVHAVTKPLGITSHDAVARARRLLGTRRVGHAGTLDPLASGVLVLLSREATKLSPFLTASAKSYLAWVAFGIGTPTLDAEPPSSPEELVSAPEAALARVGPEEILEVSRAFLHLTEQRPPAFSAIKQEGRRSYADARRGAIVEPPARAAAYHRVDLLAFAGRRDELPSRFAPRGGSWAPAEGGDAREFALPDELAPLPTALFHLEVAAGTYIRAFARDLGTALGVPAHLSGLVRVRAGRVGLEQCTDLEEIAAAPPLAAVATLPFPSLAVSAAVADAVRQGKRSSLPLAGTTALIDEEGALAAVVEPGTGDSLRILRVWQRGLAP